MTLMTRIKNQLHKRVPQAFHRAGHMLLLLVVCGVVLPKAIHYTISQKDAAQDMAAAHQELQRLSEQITALDAPVHGSGAETLSPIKEIEQLAQQSNVFASLTRLSPTERTIGGAKRRGMQLTFSDITLIDITPFLSSLAHKSTLDTAEVRITETSENDGLIDVYVTVLEGL